MALDLTNLATFQANSRSAHSVSVGWRFVALWGGLILAVSLWWLLSLARLGAYSPPFFYVEDARTTTDTAGASAALRGASNWVDYLTSGGARWWLRSGRSCWRLRSGHSCWWLWSGGAWCSCWRLRPGGARWLRPGGSAVGSAVAGVASRSWLR